jgi:uncharacterized NAD(P)/FAD-binding protein YdhS
VRAERNTEPATVAIVGGGASGVLAAVHLARLSPRPWRILLIDPACELGAGPAYATDNPLHVLNAPARTMSAVDDEPEHFVHWLASIDSSFGPSDFAPRRLYRLYLQDTLDHTRRQNPSGSTISWIRESVVDICPNREADRGSQMLKLACGQVCEANRAILAVGAPAPSVLSGFGRAGPEVVTNPWAPGVLERVPATGHVFVLGTGLTTVDVVLALASVHRSTFHARSRHGLVPAVHREDGFAAWPGLDFSGVTSAAGMVRTFRRALEDAQVAGHGWRNVVSAARDALPPVWEHLRDEEKSRFLRHASRLWEVHRHRMPPLTEKAFGAVLDAGRLTLGAGRLIDIEERPGRSAARFTVTLDDRGRREHLEVGALVDCSGGFSGVPDQIPLLQRLISRGVATADPTGRGLAVNEVGSVLGSVGRPSGVLSAMGWVRSGRCIESLAIPALRKQAARLARELSLPVQTLGGQPHGSSRRTHPEIGPARFVA